MESELETKQYRIFATLEKLKKMSLEQLHLVFTSFQAPESGELIGNYPGIILTGDLFQSLPTWIGKGFKEIISFLWRAKSFSGKTGTNLWFSSSSGRRLVPYKIYTGKTVLGTGKVLVLDYDIVKNPRIAKRILGEIRRVGDGVYLGRMLFRSKNKIRLVSYFVLYSETST